MNILGINFGHDASLSLISNNTLISFLELERVTRLKHNVGVTALDIINFLNDANLSIDDISAVAVSGTQWYKAKHSNDIELTLNNENDPIFNKFKSFNICDHFEYSGTDNWYDYISHQNRLGEYKSTAFPLDAIDSGLIGISPKNVKILIEEIKNLNSDHKQNKNITPFNKLIPYKLKIKDSEIPAFFVPHHIAHAAYGAFYRTNEQPTLIISHDGGWPHIPFNSGGIFISANNNLYPVIDPNLYIGQLYQRLGEVAGFRAAEAPGKLMGLAAYGIANAIDLIQSREKCLISSQREKKWSVFEFEEELNFLISQIESISCNASIRNQYKKFDFNFSDIEKSIGIAAYTQALTEDIWSSVLGPLIDLIGDNINVQKDIPVVGGYALNCPSNSKLQGNINAFELTPLPGGSDMGVSLGASVYLTSILTGNMPKNNDTDLRCAAFPPRPKFCKLKQAHSIKELELIEVENITEFYAAQLLDGKIFCHVNGYSEVGPRALGNRSIIAHATNESIRDKINLHKGRENWRPLAPLLRDVDFHKYFSGVDTGSASRFMLYTYRVINDKLKAVTHVDNTARAQVINDGFLYDVLSYMNDQNEIPILVNTSFNVAGEPLVESVDNAISSFKKLNFDYLFIENNIYKNLKIS
jgi:carbamoyltransferase